MVVVGENSVHGLKRTNANFATLGLRILIPLFFTSLRMNLPLFILKTCSSRSHLYTQSP